MSNQEVIDGKIKEAGDILTSFNLPDGRLQSLTLLALCGIKPKDSWENATRKSLGLSNHIMEFVNAHYKADYKPNTRESFRKNALKPFIDSNIVDLNPDDPNLSLNSSKTHYAITPLAVNTIRTYQTPEWQIALENFLKYRSPLDQEKNKAKILSVKVKGFKSVADDEISLGRFNVFIGANGSGKSNILEVLALAGAGRSNELTFDGLYSRGVRMARPNLILSSFAEGVRKTSIDLDIKIEESGQITTINNSYTPIDPNNLYSKWIDLTEEELLPEVMLKYLREITELHPEITGPELLDQVNVLLQERGHKERSYFDQILSDYAIYDLNTKSLRGITPADSQKTPLGINGEGLDIFINSFTKEDREYLNSCRNFFDWLDEIVIDKDDKLKLSGLKPGRSTSTLYFTDHFLQSQNNTFSAENSNEGVLHVLFYVALFLSHKTPRLFGIDNIETALNPRLCQVLIKLLADLCISKNKQVLITTHNPAVLDGLNLFDDEQRLFEVYRTSEGYTKTRRLQFKPDLSDKKYKLSEMWMKGLIGAVPENF